MYPALRPEERKDVVSDAVTKLIGAVQAGQLNPSRRTAPYLVSIAKHAALDLLRSRERQAPSISAEDLERASEASSSDDEVLDHLLRRLDSQAAIRQAMDRARDAGDHEVNSTVRVWLQLSESQEHERRLVSLRMVADAMDVSHTEVRRRLQKFALYLDD